MKTSELTGAALDWAVAKCEGFFGGSPPNHFTDLNDDFYCPSTNWAQGGPIIEKNILVISPDPSNAWLSRSYMDVTEYYGPTPLIAAMRCYVASKLGDEVDIPKELTR